MLYVNVLKNIYAYSRNNGKISKIVENRHFDCIGGFRLINFTAVLVLHLLFIVWSSEKNTSA